jgi:hypothetical protein
VNGNRRRRFVKVVRQKRETSPFIRKLLFNNSLMRNILLIYVLLKVVLHPHPWAALEMI